MPYYNGMARRNILIGIHGMLTTPHREPQKPGFLKIVEEVGSYRDGLSGKFTEEAQTLCFVEWGQDLADSRLENHEFHYRNDEKLRRAENTLHDRISTRHAKPDDSVPSGGLLRPVTDRIKDEVFLYGLTDVVYYCGGGEKAIRKRVYSQILEFLDPIIQQDEQIALHVLGHSLGAVIAYDFLFGVFNTARDNSDVKKIATEHYGLVGESVNYLVALRRHAEKGRVSLGSLTTVGTQIGVLTVRSQALVHMLYDGQHFDARQIGLNPELGRPQWLNCYDRDDVLGYPLKSLFAPNDCIREVEVNTSWNPQESHSLYWQSPQVLDETADNLLRNLA